MIDGGTGQQRQQHTIDKWNTYPSSDIMIEYMKHTQPVAQNRPVTIGRQSPEASSA